ncbi:MAG: hypothetical protein EOO71_16630 [Myxococcaceae bacterium]|nr:MAG: hypothetical protein EOO71_16630 [Myxococcaceae bacterium]
MMRRFVSCLLPVATLVLGGCGPETVDTQPEAAVTTTEQGLSSVTLPSVPLAFHTPPKRGGDADFAGHGPDIGVDFELLIENETDLVISMAIHGQEVGGTTWVQGIRYYHLLTTPTPILSIAAAPGGPALIGSARTVHYGYRDTGHSTDYFVYPQLIPATRFVKSMTCVGDTSGDEAGSRTGCEAVLHDLVVTY